MSDFVPRDILPDLWEEILKRHWTFLETEESIQKMEERKKLEVCLKEFLCIVPHDRKFFLPETAHVLRKSIRDMDDFSAYKAIIGFESISQYANNLFTKPWRKEFRVLKMYSGFFQHEIKSNLLNAEVLFEAMGYRRVSEEILVLDGPICPDQVTNVSRDAMAAYVECQIMKHIYAGLVAMGLTCSWQDVFHYREKYVGGTSQSIKGLAYAIQDRRLRKEKLINLESSYATIQHSPQVAAPQCPHCAPYHMPPQAPHMTNSSCALHSVNPCALHSSAPMATTNLMYNGHGGSSGGGGGSGGQNKLMTPYSTGNYHHQQHQHHQQPPPPPSPYGAPVTNAQPHMSHSRSLEHYNEPGGALAPLPHRHSFDHQQQGCTAHHYQTPHSTALAQQHLYESPYDCLDGVSVGSSASYAAVAATGGNCGVNSAYAHPYNVSGNRYPLPFNISNQLNSQYDTPTVTCNGIKDIDASYNGITLDGGGYASVTKPRNCNYHAQSQSLSQQPPLPPARHLSSAPVTKDFQNYRQRSFPPDQQLIDFDDRTPLSEHDFHAQMHAAQMMPDNGYDYEQRHSRHALANRSSMNATYAQPKDVLCQHASVPVSVSSSSQLPSSEEMYVYARPLPRSCRPSKSSALSSASATVPAAAGNMTDKYLRNMDLVQNCVDNNREMQTELKDRDRVLMNGGGGGASRRKHSSHTLDREASDLSYESALDDFVTVGHSEHPQRSPTQASKNQDGVGSFESWDYVFQNLERSGYSKDLGERGDLLVQSLDLDSLNLANGSAKGGGGGGGVGGNNGGGGVGVGGGGDKRRSHNADAKSSRQMTNGEKSRTLEKVASGGSGGGGGVTLEKRDSKTSNNTKQNKHEKSEKSILKQYNVTNAHAPAASATTTGSKAKTKSAFKSTSSGGNLKSTQYSTSASASTSNHHNDNNNGNGDAVMHERGVRTSKELNGRRQSQTQSQSSTRIANSKTGANTKTPSNQPVQSSSTQVIVTSPNEWSCRFCTFLNPDTKRICEMCCRSKDFNLEASVSNTPTCV